MSTPRDTKDYLSKKEIPQLFECLMTGLLYHRPTDHLSYLQGCLDKIRENGVHNVKWDLFLESKSGKSPLPPISRESSYVNEESASPRSGKKEKLPDISHNKKPAIALRVASHVPIVLAIGAPGCDRAFYCQEIVRNFPQFVYIPFGRILKEFIETANNSQPHHNARQEYEQAQGLIRRGEFVQQDLVIQALVNCLNQSSHAEGFVIEGFPRSIAQLNELVSKGLSIQFAFLIDSDEERARQNLLHRFTQEGIDVSVANRKVENYKKECLPLCKHLDDKQKLLVLEGEKPQQELLPILLKAFKTHLGISSSEALPRPPSVPRSSSEHSRQSARSQKHNSSRPQSYDSHKIITTNEIIQFIGEPLETIPTIEITTEDSGRLPNLPGCSIVFLMGGPGSGRSVQAQRLIQHYTDQRHIAHIDAAKISLKHDVPLEKVTSQHILEEMNNLSFQIDYILIESFPLNESQVEDFNMHIGGGDLAILLDCNEARMLNRLENGGQHAEVEAISGKLRYFKNNTLPVARYFDLKGKLNVVLGDQEVDAVTHDLQKILDANLFTKPKWAHNVTSQAPLTDVATAEEGDKQSITSVHDEEDVPLSKEDLIEAKVLFVLGGPGSGKGTQCARLVEKYGFQHLSSGDLLRAEVESGSSQGQQLEEIMKKGDLVPLEVVLGLMRKAMKERMHISNCFLIDGYPRELDQGIRFEEEVCECKCVLSFDVPEEVMKERLMKRGETSGRVDDNAETILKRLRTFNECTKPVIEYYAQKNKVAPFDASGTIDEIFEQVCQTVDNLNIISKLEDNNLLEEQVHVAAAAAAGGAAGEENNQVEDNKE